MSEKDDFSVIESSDIDRDKVIRLAEEFKATMMLQGLTQVEMQVVLVDIAQELEDFEVSQPMPCEEHGLHVLKLDKTVSTSMSELEEVLTEEEFTYFKENLNDLEKDERVPSELIDRFRE